jgi:hypothetical protein
MTFIKGFLVFTLAAFITWLRLIWLEWRQFERLCEREELEKKKKKENEKRL